MLTLSQLTASTGVFNNSTNQESLYRAHALAFIVARGCYEKRIERFYALKDICEDLAIKHEEAISWFRLTARVYEDYERAKLVVTHRPESAIKLSYN